MQVNKLFSHSVYKRFLPSDVIVKTVVTALGSWWYARMYKKTPSASQQGKLSPSELCLCKSLTLLEFCRRDSREQRLT